MRSNVGSFLRSTAFFLVFAFIWNALAHAAKPSTHLALLKAAVQTPAQSPQAAPPAPQLPNGTSAHDRLVAAHGIFLADPTMDTQFAANRTATYNAVLDALNQWGRYRIVNSPAEADLTLQIHGRVTEVDTPGTPPDYTPSVSFYSHLDLTLNQPTDLSPLWKVSIPLQSAARHKTRATNIAIAGENAVSSLKIAAGAPLTRQDRAALKTIHDAHTRGLILGLAGIGLVAGMAIVGVTLARRHARDFCHEHGLSPCPGA